MRWNIIFSMGKLRIVSLQQTGIITENHNESKSRKQVMLWDPTQMIHL